MPTTQSSARPTAIPNFLTHYTSHNPLRSPSPVPPSSRVDPRVAQRSPPKMAANPLTWSFAIWLAYIRFLIVKGIHIIWSLISHLLWGPARKSWGYRMTFITSTMRNVKDYTSLADIVLIRRLISLHFLVPLPADAVVTPITFTVPKRTGPHIENGFFKDLDREETGTRELAGEWVVGTEVWKRLKHARRVRNRQARLAPPTSSSSGGPSRSSTLGTGSENSIFGRESPDVGNDSESAAAKKLDGERVIYYIHGGAYYVGNAATHRLITIGVSKACNARVFAITYRLAPEHIFPLPLHDVLHGYLRLLAPPLSIAPENIVIAGDSAGGGLGLALAMYLRDEGYKMPAGLVLMSPWVDLTMSCGSWDENADSDVVPRPDAGDHLNPVHCYLGPRGIVDYITHPYASPIFGHLHDLPPMLIQSGQSEVLRDEITLLAHKAALAGTHVTHELYEDMVHVFQLFTWLPATKTAIASVGRWVRATLPKIQEERATRAHMSTGTDNAIDGEVESAPTIVDAAGEEVGHGLRPEGTVDELHAVQDSRDRFRERESPRNTHARDSSLGLQLGGATSPSKPSIDLDSLPSSTTPTSSGSITPTGSPVSHRGLLFHQNHAPQLRRALTDVASSTPNTPITSPSRTTTTRRRRRTQGALSLHVSPSVSIAHSQSSGTSNPVSPTPSIRRRLRSPTMSSGHPQPSTRMRSQSHSDIFNLVEGYNEGGAANETVVYNPGGQIRSVGVLGDPLENGDEEME